MNGKFWTDALSLGDVRFRTDRLSIPLRAKKPRVYAVWSDLYHPGVSDDDILDTWQVMVSDQCAHHTFLIVTKRPDRVFRVADDGVEAFPQNIWHIVTMEDQFRANERMPHLLRIPGNKGVIIEPMLGPVDLRAAGAWRACTAVMCQGGDCHDCGHGCVQQVILGGETGPHARPMQPAWAMAVRNQCKSADVPFYFKSMGGRAKRRHLLDGRAHTELAWEVGK
jgi:protein gp37